MNYMSFKPKYICNLETEDTIYSSTELKFFTIDPIEYFKNKKITPVHSESFFEDRIEYINITYKTAQGFYIYCEKNEEWIVSIYYRQEQQNELILFINQLKKIITK